jgi:hypothetical protein
MWINELLYVLMFAALTAVIVLAVVVNMRLRRSKQLEQIETTDEITSEPIADLVVEQEPEPVLEPETKTVPNNLPEIMVEPEPLPEYEHEPLVDIEPESKFPPEPEDSPDEMSYYVEEDELRLEDKDFGVNNESKVEETVDLEMPFIVEFPQETKEEQVMEAGAESWYVPEEPTDKNEEEEGEGVMMCPHCNSQVPNTIYCIYCGNSLKPNPLVEEP